MKVSLVGLVAFALLSVSSSTSLACNSQDAVRDSRNSVLKDSNGNCVRTMWKTNLDPCGKKHQSTADNLMKMDERKIYFAFDKANLKSSEIEKLQKVVGVLKEDNITKSRL